MKSLALVCVLFIVGRSELHLFGDDPARVRAWLAATNDVWSYDVDCSFSKTRDGQILEQQKRRQRFVKDGRWRCDSRVESSWASSSFDGTQFHDRNEVGDFVSKTISARAAAAMKHRHSFFPHELSLATFHGVAYADVFAERIKTVQRRSATIYYFPPLMEVRRLVEYADVGVLVEFGDGRCDMPTRLAVLDDSGKVSSQLCGEYRWIDGKPFPKTIRKETYVNGTLAAISEMDCEVRAINCDIPNSIFSLEVPLGAVVYDEGEGSNYIKTERIEKDFEAYQKLVLSKKNDSPPKDSLFVLFFCLLCGAIILYFGFRYFRDNKRQGIAGCLVSFIAFAGAAGCNSSQLATINADQFIGIVDGKAKLEFVVCNRGENIPVEKVEKSCQCFEVVHPPIVRSGNNIFL